MRIVQAVGWYFPESLGGTEIYVDALATRLQGRQHDVIVAAPDPGGRDERHYQHNGVQVYRYATTGAVTRDQARGRAVVPGAERFHAWLQRMRPDVVHFHTFVTGLSLCEVDAARRTGARVIVTSHAGSLGFLCERGTLMRHGVEVCDARVPARVCAACALAMRGVPAIAAELAAALPSPIASAGLSLPGRVGTALGMRALIEDARRAQGDLFERIDAFVVLTDWAARALATTGAPPDKVVVNRLGVVLHGAPPARRERQHRIVFGFAGRSESIKGLDTAVAAVASLPREADVELRIAAVARGDAERAMLEHCRSLANDDPRVRFEEALRPDAMPGWLATLDALLCPSRAIEGGPTVALEARAVGTPVIGSRVPALTEIVRDGIDGLLHTPGDAAALAACLRTIVADPASTLDAWRGRLPPPRTADDVADDYTRLYRAA